MRDYVRILKEIDQLRIADADANAKAELKAVALANRETVRSEGQRKLDELTAEVEAANAAADATARSAEVSAEASANLVTMQLDFLRAYLVGEAMDDPTIDNDAIPVDPLIDVETVEPVAGSVAVEVPPQE